MTTYFEEVRKPGHLILRGQDCENKPSTNNILKFMDLISDENCRKKTFFSSFHCKFALLCPTQLKSNLRQMFKFWTYGILKMTTETTDLKIIYLSGMSFCF